MVVMVVVDKCLLVIVIVVAILVGSAELESSMCQSKYVIDGLNVTITYQCGKRQGV